MNILDNRIIAILRDVDAENIVDVINALVGGGIISIEIPLNQYSRRQGRQSPYNPKIP